MTAPTPPPLHVAGLSPGSLAASDVVRGLVAQARVLAGGRRLLAAFPDFAGERVPVAGPLDAVLDRLARARDQGEPVLVLADGDPLFFGLGARLLERFGPQALVFHPAPTAVQVAAARLGLPHAEVPAVSLHGRQDPGPLLAALSWPGRAFVYTDPAHTPAAIGRMLADLDPGAFALTVLEDLDTPEERIRRLSPAQAAGLEFSPLNLVLAEWLGRPDRLSGPPPFPPLALGLPDRAFAAEKGLITKGPVRAAGLAALGLLPGSVVWDVGAGCGSVAVEAAALARRGRVFALERHPGRLEMIRENVRRFGAWHVAVVPGEAPGAWAGLPAPDRVFVGGGLGRSPGVAAAAFEALRPGGVLVAHCVLLGSLEAARRTLADQGAEVSVTMIQACQSGPLAGDLRLQAQNPVFIVRAEKGPGGGD